MGRDARAQADGAQVPMPIQVAILVKVLSYDHALAARAKEGLTVGVVFSPKVDDSREAKDAFVRAFKEAPRLVGGKPVELVEVPEDLVEAEAKKGVDVLYLCGGVDVAKAITLGKELDLVSFAPDRGAVESGVVLGLVPRNGKPKLLINVPASLDAGMRLDPQILGLAELVR